MHEPSQEKEKKKKLKLREPIHQSNTQVGDHPGNEMPLVIPSGRHPPTFHL